MTTIQVPDELAREIDQLACLVHRFDFATEVLRREIRRNRQCEALRSSAGSWGAEDHPELAWGGVTRAVEIRAEPDERFEDALKKRQD